MTLLFPEAPSWHLDSSEPTHLRCHSYSRGFLTSFFLKAAHELAREDGALLYQGEQNILITRERDLGKPSNTTLIPHCVSYVS